MWQLPEVPVTVSLSQALPEKRSNFVRLVREMQEKLRNATPDEVDAAFHVLLPAVEELSCDADGHTVVEELLQRGTVAQRLELATQLRRSAARLSTDANGCWVIQKAIQVLPCEQQALLFAALAADIDGCIESRHGNFVVQASIEHLPPDDVSFVVRAVEKNAKQTASHKYGCRVIQRLLEHCPAIQVERILEQIVHAALDLSRNQYGCHVLRCVLAHGRQEDKKRIIQVMWLNMAQLSRNRLASMVIEKCIEVACEGEHASYLQGERTALTHAVLYGQASGSEDPQCDGAPLEQMLRTRFGRGILRRLVQYVSPEEREALQRRLS
jgi:pumilio RNA-binding family